MWDHCTGTPRRLALVRHRPHRTHRQFLHLAPCPLPSLPVAPRRAMLASSAVGRASSCQAGLSPPAAPPRVVPASAATGRASTR
uniref:Uncharacterized protein n=1 Tax=Oryza nivara TaxID=4536 RepID=A0A0E0GYI3_ORYNI